MRGDDPLTSLRVISPARDFLLIQEVAVNSWLEAGSVKPAPGDLHPNPARYPGWKLCGLQQGRDANWARLVYLKPLTDQQAYNWEYANTCRDVAGCSVAYCCSMICANDGG